MADASHDPMHDVFHHVRDAHYFELPQGMHLALPEFLGFQLTKYMVLQVVAGLLALWIFRGLAKRLSGGNLAPGRWWNFWESLALYIRDEVVRPTIGEGHDHDHDDHGHHDAHEPEIGTPAHTGHVSQATIGHGEAAIAGHPADKYLPFVWSSFFYVLFCNLLGAVPWLGSATAEINVTGALALTAFIAVVMYGSAELGFSGFWKAQAPHMDVPQIMKPPLVAMVWCIEVLGLFIKHGVLAVRLFANIMAGHTVIAVMLAFIAVVAHSGLFYVVLPASIAGQIGIGLLELFVAFLQAYIFAFLAALFIGTAVHPH